MFVIGEAVIDDAVACASFACDLRSCRGACCTLPGGRGAPLEDAERAEIALAFPHARQFLGEASLRAIEAAGLTEGPPGDLATPCIGARECVFAYFEEGIARCSFEAAYERGLTRWRKPLSCHLFPIRIRHFGKYEIRYEMIAECAPGRARGELQSVPLTQFLREPLTRRFGEAWYQEFLRACAARAAADDQADAC
ncbi:MAG TPA: DUF3109 family protein [Bacteroidota bacterium]|nr:DUF3109 family protein [Bacteroidota bacterium]